MPAGEITSRRGRSWAFGGRNPSFDARIRKRHSSARGPTRATLGTLAASGPLLVVVVVVVDRRANEGWATLVCKHHGATTAGEEGRCAFSGRAGGMMVRAALAKQADPQLEIALPLAPARFVRLKLGRSIDRDPWVVTDVVVKGVR